jgi:hypothetical protein
MAKMEQQKMESERQTELARLKESTNREHQPATGRREDGERPETSQAGSKGGSPRTRSGFHGHQVDGRVINQDQSRSQQVSANSTSKQYGGNKGSIAPNLPPRPVRQACAHTRLSANEIQSLWEKRTLGGQHQPRGQGQNHDSRPDNNNNIKGRASASSATGPRSLEVATSTERHVGASKDRIGNMHADRME